MAVSASFDFTLNRDALIKRAMLMLGVISADQTPTDSEKTAAGNALNLMLKSWQTDGLHLFAVQQTSVTPVASQEKYPFGSVAGVGITTRPTDILEVYRRTTTSKVDVPLTRLSRTDYFTLGDKDTTGTPVNFYYDVQLGDGQMYVWPTSDATFASDNTLEVLWSKPFDDMDAAGDTLAFPSEWELAIVYGLCVILAPEYGLPTTDQRLFIQQAEKEKQKVLDWDQEHTSVFFGIEAR